MKRLFTAAVMLVLFFGCFAFAAEESSGPAASIPQLKSLDEYAGEWDVKLTIKNADQAEGMERTGHAVGKWRHGGRFMEQTWKVNAADGQPEFSGSSMRTYDTLQNKYRTWSFDSSGMAEESEGTWNKATRTMTWTVDENQAGGSTLTKSMFHDDGRETWSILIKDRDGQTLGEVQGESVRRRE